MDVLYYTCAMPVVQIYMDMNDRQIVEKLRNTELRETCEYVNVLDFYTTQLSTFLHVTNMIKK